MKTVSRAVYLGQDQDQICERVHAHREECWPALGLYISFSVNEYARDQAQLLQCRIVPKLQMGLVKTICCSAKTRPTSVYHIANKLFQHIFSDYLISKGLIRKKKEGGGGRGRACDWQTS